MWIARDINDCLCLHEEKPYCSANGVWYNLRQMIQLSKDLFPEVTFENSPQEIVLVLKDEYNHLKEIEEIHKEEGDYGDKHYC